MLGVLGVKDDILDVDEACRGILAGGAVLNLGGWPWLLAGEVGGDDYIVRGGTGVSRIGQVDVQGWVNCESGQCTIDAGMDRLQGGADDGEGVWRCPYGVIIV